MRKSLLGFCVVVAALVFTQQSNAEFTVTFEEVGADVQGTFSGSINLDATGGFFGGPFGAYNGHLDTLGAIASSGLTEGYNVDFAGYTPFGNSGNFLNWDATSGDAFAFFTDPVLGVPVGYVSGDEISGTLTQLNSTFNSLGWTPGTYVTTFSNSGISDNLVVNIGIPEPTTFGLMGLLGLAAVIRRRR